MMVKDYSQPSLIIEEAYVFSVVKLLRNDCEKLGNIDFSMRPTAELVIVLRCRHIAP